jgi:hypothetical protein
MGRPQGWPFLITRRLMYAPQEFPSFTGWTAYLVPFGFKPTISSYHSAQDVEPCRIYVGHDATSPSPRGCEQ